MSKHKKTRKEKIVADYRHQVYILKNKDLPLNTNAPAIAINDNSYFNSRILRDFLKTGILTLSIVAGELILFFLLKNHVVTLPMVKY